MPPPARLLVAPTLFYSRSPSGNSRRWPAGGFSGEELLSLKQNNEPNRMMRSANWWTCWTTSFWMQARRVCLLVILGIFATASLLTASTQEQPFTGTVIKAKDAAPITGGDLDATIESSESPISMAVVSRDTASGQEQPQQSRFITEMKMRDLRCLPEPGTTGPPSIPNNTFAAA